MLASCEQCFCLTCNQHIACVHLPSTFWRMGWHRSCRVLVIELRVCAGPELDLSLITLLRTTTWKLNVVVAATNSEWSRVSPVRNKRMSGQSCLRGWKASGEANGKWITIYGFFEFGISRNQEEHLKVERSVPGVVRTSSPWHSVNFRITQPRLAPEGDLELFFDVFFLSESPSCFQALDTCQCMLYPILEDSRNYTSKIFPWMSTIYKPDASQIRRLLISMGKF